MISVDSKIIKEIDVNYKGVLDELQARSCSRLTVTVSPDKASLTGSVRFGSDDQPNLRLLSPASCRQSSRCLLFISSSSHAVPPSGVNSSASRLRLRPPRTRRSAPSATASLDHAHPATRCSPTPKHSRASGFQNKTTTGSEPFKPSPKLDL